MFTVENVCHDENRDVTKANAEESIDDLWRELRDGDDRSNEVNEQVTRATEMIATFEIDEVIEEEIKHEDVEERNVKVSTACGPSPDREIEEIFTNKANEKPLRMMSPSVNRHDMASRSSKVSIGTSPPPQSTSTQVYKY